MAKISKYEIPTNVKKFSEINNQQSGVYVFENIMTPGIYKIGLINRTAGCLLDRIKEQESVQWVLPGSIRCIMFVPTDMPEKLEHALHSDPDLSKSRCNEKRELFQTSLLSIYEEMKNYASLVANEIIIVSGSEFSRKFVPMIKNPINELEDGKYIYNGRSPFEFRYTKQNDKYIINIDGEDVSYDNFSQFVNGCRNNGYKVSNIKKIFIKNVEIYR